MGKTDERARELIDSITAEYRRYKKLGDGAFAQLSDEELSRAAPDDNSVAMIVWHIAGNLKTRFTDFQTTDGEKPWRNRDDEFVDSFSSRQALLDYWNSGWDCVANALDALTPSDLDATVTVRGEPLSVPLAIARSLSHCGYHVGQIVLISRILAGDGWQTLTIPRGGSQQHNSGNWGREQYRR